jgi:hypothetical protein
VGDVAGYKLTRKNLPQEANLLMFMETGQTLTIIHETLQAAEGAVPGFPKIGKLKPFKGDPAFIGIALALQGDTATFNLFVPGATIAASHGLITEMLKTFE